VKLKPDIEVAFITPVAACVDSGGFATISEINIVARNSVDSEIREMIWEYYDRNGTQFLGPFEIAMHLQVPGLVSPEEADTVVLLSVPLPVDTVLIYLLNTNQYEARAHIGLVAYDEYEMSSTDTAWFDFGLYRNP
jgi:hypothetical protein